MKNKFLIASKKFTQNFKQKNFKQIDQSDIGDIYYQGDAYNTKNIAILMEGYVLPRNNIFNQYKDLEQFELIHQLYNEHGNKFVHYIKGFFLVVIIKRNEIIIANDIHSVKRVVYLQDNNDFIISNDVGLLSETRKLSLSRYAPAMMAAFQHFVDGYTMFEDVFYGKPASLIQINDKKMVLNNYLAPDYFAKLPRNKYTENDFHETFFNAISNYLNYLKPESISTTLTGGRDTRSILSVLLSLNQNPHCFTFGYPTGIDVITSKNIAKTCNLEFSNHYIHDLNEDSYGQLVEKIGRYKNPFIHLHRAHRLDAILKERSFLAHENSMVFVGAMGGDYINGEKFNDYILTEFIRRYLTGNEDEDTLISAIFIKHYIKYNEDDINFIKSVLKSMRLEHNIFDKNTEFNLVHKIIGSTHDIQDISLFMENSKYVMAPFMDIDVMEVLFNSQLSLFNNTKHSKNPFLRLKGGELQCSLIKKYSPQLSNIPFANQYTPNDVLGNRLKYVIKRMYLHAFKIKSKPTFTYEKWFERYINQKLDNIDNEINFKYDVDKMKNELKSDYHNTNEGYWHKYSNPVMLNLYNKDSK